MGNVEEGAKLRRILENAAGSPDASSESNKLARINAAFSCKIAFSPFYFVQITARRIHPIIFLEMLGEESWVLEGIKLKGAFLRGHQIYLIKNSKIYIIRACKRR
ncbi:G-Protein Coupled Receptor 84 [Manis pentadactyla]|nr:G-Protein Coupled Receptor 84 [Manis pentadactyla]